MCGIVGILSKFDSRESLSRQVTKMADSLIHRGPDSSGVWVANGIALGQRRLAILDLSPAGHQPMVSRSGRYILTYNGEIYNFRAIRAELESEGCLFKSLSDTEVLVEGIEHWGLESMLKKSIGMFAFGLWDTKKRKLMLVRDRFGVKPYIISRKALHWHFHPRVVRFVCFLILIMRLMNSRLEMS